MQKLVIFEGCDGVGKTTLYQAYRRATAYQILCIDRYIGSQIVYDELYGREDKSEVWFKEEENLSNLYDVYLAILSAPIKTIRVRIAEKERGPDLTRALRNFELANNLFGRYFGKSRIVHKMMLDSSDSVIHCLEYLLSFTGEEMRADPGRAKFESSRTSSPVEEIPTDPEKSGEEVPPAKTEN